MSEINSIANGTFTIGQTSATNFIAGNGITIDSPSAGTVRIGNDETVLWSGERTSAVQTSESMKNFDKCQIYIAQGTYGPPQVYTVDFADMDTTGYFAIVRPRGASNFNLAGIRFTADATHLAVVNSKCISFNSWSNGQTAFAATYSEPEDLNSIIRVVGINRISGSNA